MTKQYVGFVRDHSISMTGLKHKAMQDYNENVATIQEESSRYNIDTIVSVVECGAASGPTLLRGGYGKEKLVNVDVVNSGVKVLKPLTTYRTSGGNTPLLDSVAKLIQIMRDVPDVNDPDVSFLVMVITDGEENSSSMTSKEFSILLNSLVATDRWTFAFRVPKGYKQNIVRLGVQPGNVMEWDLTEQGFETATTITKSGFSNYYQIRSSGVTSSAAFFPDLGAVTPKVLQTELDDITGNLSGYAVQNSENGMFIRDFVIKKCGAYYPGKAFYQLTKSEDVQSGKEIIIKHNTTGHYYGGQQARNALGLPSGQSFKLRPSHSTIYTIFVQSTSYNRKLISGTSVLVSH